MEGHGRFPGSFKMGPRVWSKKMELIRVATRITPRSEVIAGKGSTIDNLKCFMDSKEHLGVWGEASDQ